MQNGENPDLTMLDISDNLLKRLAGVPAFDAGRQLRKHDAVTDCQSGGHTVQATVSDGDNQYQVKLTHTRNTLDGVCDCEISGGIDFCAHSVALALVWREQMEQQQLASHASDAERLALYITSLPGREKDEALLQLVQQQEPTRQQWLLRADRALGTLTAGQLRKRINQLLPMQARSGGALLIAVDDCVATLKDCAADLAPAKLAELCSYTLQRIAALTQNDVIQHADSDAIEKLQELMLQGIVQSDWSNAELSTFVLELMCSEHPTLLPPLPDALLPNLSDSQQQHLFNTIRDSWEVTGAQPLFEALYQAAEREHDWGGLAALLEQDANSVETYLLLVSLHIKMQQYQTAAEWLHRARTSADANQHRTDITRAAVDLHLARGEITAAFDAQWQLFRNTLLARDLLSINPDIEPDRDGLIERGRVEIERQIAAATKQRGQAILYERLAQFLLDSGDAIAAAELAGAHAVGMPLLEQLLEQLDDVALAQPLAFRLAQQWVETSSNPNYRRAVDLLKSWYEQIDSQAQRRQFQQSLQSLRQRTASKRNFIRWLDEAIPMHSLPSK